jgi:hypothetical protein
MAPPLTGKNGKVTLGERATQHLEGPFESADRLRGLSLERYAETFRALTLPSPAKRARVRQKFFGAKTPSPSPLGEGWGEGNFILRRRT